VDPGVTAATGAAALSPKKVSMALCVGGQEPPWLHPNQGGPTSMSLRAIGGLIMLPLFLLVFITDSCDGPEKDVCYSWEDC
jgi:hypothetical protein